MLRISATSVLLVALSVFGQPRVVLAQVSSPEDPKPRSAPSGYTGQALRQLYNEDVGQGYTTQSQNYLSLQQQRAKVPYVGQSQAGLTSTGPNLGRLGLGVSAARTSKPFSSVTSTPTVSPYLNLFREDLGGNDDLNYQTLVRPQIQQQQANQQFERQNQELARRVQAISAQSAYKNPAGSEQQYPTGHQTVFMYTGHYYPNASPQRRRQ